MKVRAAVCWITPSPHSMRILGSRSQWGGSATLSWERAVEDGGTIHHFKVMERCCVDCFLIYLKPAFKNKCFVKESIVGSSELQDMSRLTIRIF